MGVTFLLVAFGIAIGFILILGALSVIEEIKENRQEQEKEKRRKLGMFGKPRG